MSGPPLITEYGKRLLGEVLKESREREGWSLDDLVYEIKSRTGCKLSKSALHNLERGYSSPTWDTLAILSDVGYVQINGAAIDAHVMLDIASERYNFPGQQTRIQKIRRGLQPRAAEKGSDYIDRRNAFIPATT